MARGDRFAAFVQRFARCPEAVAIQTAIERRRLKSGQSSSRAPGPSSDSITVNTRPSFAAFAGLIEIDRRPERSPSPASLPWSGKPDRRSKPCRSRSRRIRTDRATGTFEPRVARENQQAVGRSFFAADAAPAIAPRKVRPKNKQSCFQRPGLEHSARFIRSVKSLIPAVDSVLTDPVNSPCPKLGVLLVQACSSVAW